MTRAFTLFSLLVISACLLLLGGRRSLSSTAGRRFAPVMRLAPDKTLNWAGYVAETSLKKPKKHAVTDVRGTWQVPTVASSGALDTSSAIWVGIDGAADRTVEQIGTEQDWYEGYTVYYAWYEMYPKIAYYIPSVPVEPGDQITAEVQLISKNMFLLSISNLTENVGFSITEKRAAQCSSAEWIVEAPYFHRILLLADFGSVTFTNCRATIEGVEGTISEDTWQNESITMEAPKTSAVLAQPSALTPDGSGFTVTWQQN
ncbi:MAG: G1 family glutamic endopeptidase [Verrucomicrobiia bacterium]